MLLAASCQQIALISFTGMGTPAVDGVSAIPKRGKNAPAASGSAIALYAKAHARFWWTLAIVARLSCKTSTTYTLLISAFMMEGFKHLTIAQ